MTALFICLGLAGAGLIIGPVMLVWLVVWRLATAAKRYQAGEL